MRGMVTEPHTPLTDDLFAGLQRRLAAGPRPSPTTARILLPVLRARVAATRLAGSYWHVHAARRAGCEQLARWARPTFEVPAGGWVAHRIVSATESTVVLAGPAGKPVEGIIKLPYSDAAWEQLLRQERVLRALAADPRAGDLRSLLPLPVRCELRGGRRVAVERALPGQTLWSLRGESASYAAGLAAARRVLNTLQGDTGTQVTVGQDLVERWVASPMALMAALAARLRDAQRYSAPLERLTARLTTWLEGRTVVSCWIHGDFWPANIMVEAGGAHVTGVVDWGRAASGELPLHDALQLLLHEPQFAAGGGSLDRTVLGLLEDPRRLAELRPLLAEWGLASGVGDDLRNALLLYWFRYVPAFLAKCPSLLGNPWWLDRNVGRILLAV